MVKCVLWLLAIGLMATLSVAAVAQDGRRGDRALRIRERQQRQQVRIAEGVRSGELTRRETIRLEREQRGIQLEKREARSDGDFTRDERRDIYREQNQASRHIYRAKHNRRDRN